MRAHTSAIALAVAAATSTLASSTRSGPLWPWRRRRRHRPDFHASFFFPDSSAFLAVAHCLFLFRLNMCAYDFENKAEEAVAFERTGWLHLARAIPVPLRA
ncbi:hypothetical protein BDA96_03G037200 [Sorghum bicolor]|uniref:Uncharacterized protein n=2 Tax=Sorghum bicolor TaxID=4558 RepID=C5XLX9_SORBI|nr:hypothetical protein SORBI_3003G034200 [Sorghum bicolor]KAG0536118.1 hypothetical protein BDA96_03G037200 [Sorghum bicolor]